MRRLGFYKTGIVVKLLFSGISLLGWIGGFVGFGILLLFSAFSSNKFDYFGVLCLVVC